MKKLVSLLTVIAMLSSMAFTVAQAEEDYSRIGFGNSQFGDLKSYYSKGKTVDLSEYILALDADGEDTFFEDYENLTYSSSNENVVTISDDGEMTMRDYGVATVTANYGKLSTSMLITVYPKMHSEMDSAKEKKEVSFARTGTKVAFKYADDSKPTESGHLIMRFETFHWPADPKKSNIVVEGWFYDNGQTVNAETGIGFRRNSDYTNTGAIGVLHSTDTTYQISSVHGNNDNIYDTDIEGSAVTDTKIARAKGWHQVTLVESYPGASGNITGTATKSSNGTLTKSAKYSIYLDGQLVKTSNSLHDTQWQVYGCAGMTPGTTGYFDDGMIAHYMQVNGVTLAADENDGEKLVANVDYVGNSGTNAPVAYQWYYAASEDATEWTKIEGATEKGYKPENLPSGSFIKAGAKVTETIDSVQYTTEEYFSAPTFVFDGTYTSISLGKSASYTTKGSTIALAVTGISNDGMEKTISDFSEMTFSSSNEKIATVSANGVVTAVDYGVATITANYGELSASMLITVTPKVISTEQTSSDKVTTHTRTGDTASTYTNVNYDSKPRDDSNNEVSGHIRARYIGISEKGDSQKSNIVAEGWFYDNGATVNAESAIGFRRRNDYSNTGAIGILKSADTTYKISSVHGRWDEIWDTDIEGTNAKDTGIQRTKGWHQVTLVEANPAGNVVEDSKSKSTECEIYLDGQLVKTISSAHKTNYMVYGYTGFTQGSTAWFDDGMNIHYMQLKGVTLTADENDAEKLVANVDYLGYSGTNASVAYQWYYAASEDAAEWTKIEGATEKAYKPENLPAGSFVKASAKVTETIDSVQYTTEEYFSEPTLIFDGSYASISLGKSASYTTKGSTIALVVTGILNDGMESTIEDLSKMTFSSSDEQTVTVSADGIVTAVDYGVATITANYKELSTSMLVTVTPAKINESTHDSKTTVIARRGVGASAFTVEDPLNAVARDDSGKNVEGRIRARYTTFHSPADPKKSNIVVEGWFYDSGETTEKAESAIGFMKPQDYSNTGVIGVLHSTDTTYKISNVHGRWDEIWDTDIEGSNAQDTGIQRTRGWHQVTLVEANPGGNVVESDKARSTECEIYLDGQLIKTDSSTHKTKYRVYGIAGFTEGTTSYFDDGLNAYYVGLKDVEITKEDKVLKASYTYYGPLSNSTVSYQWYNNKNGEWVAINGANDATFALSDDMNGASFKVLVNVTDTVNGTAITTDRESKEYSNVETAVSYADGKVTVRAAEDIDGVLIIAEYETVNGYKTLKTVRTIPNIKASEGEVKYVETGVISGKVMLWKSIDTQVPYCDAYEIN